MLTKLIKLIEENSCQIDGEIQSLASQLADLVASKKENDDIVPIIEWLDKKRNNYRVGVEEIGVNELQKWHVNPETGNITHESGKFYSIIGIKITGATDREVTSWTQPVIKQEECGILGIITKKINGVRHYLLQAKFEPGNRHLLQLSPTLQATVSNLKQAHKGKKPLLAEYFEADNRAKILLSVESVEDGGRLFAKTNRNIIIEIAEDENPDVPDNFIWINPYQLKKLLKIDLVINSLTRNILGSL